MHTARSKVSIGYFSLTSAVASDCFRSSVSVIFCYSAMERLQQFVEEEQDIIITDPAAILALIQSCDHGKLNTELKDPTTLNISTSTSNIRTRLAIVTLIKLLCSSSRSFSMPRSSSCYTTLSRSMTSSSFTSAMAIWQISSCTEDKTMRGNYQLSYTHHKVFLFMGKHTSYL